jgi:hypothetical protein
MTDSDMTWLLNNPKFQRRFSNGYWRWVKVEPTPEPPSIVDEGEDFEESQPEPHFALVWTQYAVSQLARHVDSFQAYLGARR